MSDPILPLPPVAEGTTQIDIEVNDGWLRLEALSREVVGVANSPSVTTDGTVYIVGSAPTGAFSSFDEDDLTIYRGGNWYAWAPVTGIVVNQNGNLKAWDGSWSDIGGGGGGSRNTVTAVTSSSGVVTLDYSQGDYFTLTLSENVTSWVISNPPGSGEGFSLMVQITQGAGAYTVAKPGTTAGGTALGVSSANGAVDLLAITSFDNGTTLRSTIAKAFA